MTRPDLTLAREIEAAIAWWHASGVDCDYHDDATAWLADAPLEAPAAIAARSGKSRSAPPSGQPRQAAARRITPDPATLPPASPHPSRRDWLGDSPPGDLAAFRAWWMAAPELETVRLNPRIPPRGPAGAALMVLVPQPEEHDRERLMEGPQGRLLANILAAMGVEDSAIYLASALPCHTPMADLGAIGAGGMDAVVTHHIALVAPQRLLVLGSGLTALLGPADNDQSGDQSGLHLREINHAGGKTPVMVSETLEAMMDMPRLKARFWKRWIAWSAS